MVVRSTRPQLLCLNRDRHAPAGSSAPGHLAEIKSLAWAQIAESGAAALSLRGIARDMGMTSSALYRYFPSRDQLLTALARDGFTSLADALEAAEADALKRSEPLNERFLRTVRAYRAWCLAHPSEYALMFGTPGPGLRRGWPGGRGGDDPRCQRALPGHDHRRAERRPPAAAADRSGRGQGPGQAAALAERTRVRSCRRRPWPPACLPGTSCTAPSLWRSSAMCLPSWSPLTTCSTSRCGSCWPPWAAPNPEAHPAGGRPLQPAATASRLPGAEQPASTPGRSPARARRPAPGAARSSTVRTISGAAAARSRASSGPISPAAMSAPASRSGRWASWSAEPPHRVGGQGRVEPAPPGFPAAETGMVVGAVMAAGIAGHGLEQVGPPHRPVDHDGLGRHRSSPSGAGGRSRRTSTRTPRSAPSWPGDGSGSRKYRSPATTPTRSKAPGMQHGDQASGPPRDPSSGRA